MKINAWGRGCSSNVLGACGARYVKNPNIVYSLGDLISVLALPNSPRCAGVWCPIELSPKGWSEAKAGLNYRCKSAGRDGLNADPADCHDGHRPAQSCENGAFKQNPYRQGRFHSPPARQAELKGGRATHPIQKLLTAACTFRGKIAVRIPYFWSDSENT